MGMGDQVRMDFFAAYLVNPFAISDTFCLLWVYWVECQFLGEKRPQFGGRIRHKESFYDTLAEYSIM